MPRSAHEQLELVLAALVRGTDPAPFLDGHDPAAFAEEAARYRCAAILSNAFANNARLASLRSALRVHEVATAFRCERLRAQLRDVVETLNAAAVEPVLLKGAARLWEQRPGYQLHDSVDLDLLVREGEMRKAQTALRDAGYREFASAAALRYYEKRHHHAAPLVPARGVSVELHRELFLREALSTDTRYEALTQHMRPAESGGRVLVLDATANAFHLIVHAFGRAPLRDLYLLADALRGMSPQERGQLQALLAREQRERVRLQAVAYQAACMAGIAWPADDAVRRFAHYCAYRANLDRRLLVRTDCADAALAHPQHPFAAFARAAFGPSPIDEAWSQRVIRQPVRWVARANAGARILLGFGKPARRQAMRSAIRRAVRSNPTAYRTFTALRDRFTRWLPAKLPPQTQELLQRYPELATFARGARSPRHRVEAFTRLAESNFTSTYLNAELRRAFAGTSGSRLMEYRRNLPILQTPDFTLKIRFCDPDTGAEGVITPLRDAFFAAIGSTVEMHRYSIPQPMREGKFDRNAMLDHGELLRLQPGAVAQINAAQHACTFDAPPSGAALLVLEYGEVQPLCWKFDGRTHKCVAGTWSDITASRLRETLELAADLGVKDVVTPAKSLLNHPSHLVRLTALSTISRLADRDAIPVLRRAARDRHPHLRRAAQRLLEVKR